MAMRKLICSGKVVHELQRIFIDHFDMNSMFFFFTFFKQSVKLLCIRRHRVSTTKQF